MLAPLSRNSNYSKQSIEMPATQFSLNRYNKDFASEDKAERDRKHNLKMQYLERKRIE